MFWVAPVASYMMPSVIGSLVACCAAGVAGRVAAAAAAAGRVAEAAVVGALLFALLLLFAPQAATTSITATVAANRANAHFRVINLPPSLFWSSTPLHPQYENGQTRK